MSRDKQIEEISKVLYESDNKRNVVICGIEAVAEDIYNAGYRKASEVAEEIFAEIENLTRRYHSDEWYLVAHMEYDIAELKKKYISEDTNVTTNTEEGK